MEVPELGKSAASERAEVVTEADTIDITEAEIAFLVYRTKEGNTVMTTDINVPLTVERQPTFHEITGSLHNVLDDIKSQQGAVLTGNQVVGMQMQMARQAAEMRVNQDALKGLRL